MSHIVYISKTNSKYIYEKYHYMNKEKYHYMNKMTFEKLMSMGKITI